MISESNGFKSVDGFEAELLQGLMSSEAPASCFKKMMLNRFPPGNEELNLIVEQLGPLFIRWLGEQSVFEVHPVKQTKLGDFHQRRIYLIEDSQGNLMMLDLTFIKRLGEWYLLKFNLSSQRESVNKALGVEL